MLEKLQMVAFGLTVLLMGDAACSAQMMWHVTIRTNPGDTRVEEKTSNNIRWDYVQVVADFEVPENQVGKVKFEIATDGDFHTFVQENIATSGYKIGVTSIDPNNAVTNLNEWVTPLYSSYSIQVTLYDAQDNFQSQDCIILYPAPQM